MKQKRSIQIRATKGNEDEIYGIFILSGLSPKRRFQAMTGEFRTDSLGRLLTPLSLSDLFFYGNWQDYEANFRDRQEAIRNSEIFTGGLVEKYIGKSGSRRRDDEGLSKIAIGKMNQDNSREELVKGAMEFYAFLMQDIRRDLETHNLSPVGTTVSRSEKAFLSRLPQYLRTLIIQNGFYLRTSRYNVLPYNAQTTTTEGIG